MIQVEHVQVEGFRGFPTKSDVFELRTPAVLLFGDNHQCKSSILNAIEWCLYGDQCVGGKSGIRERVGGWEVVNRNASGATVELAIESEQGVTIIKRAEVKGLGKKGRSVEVILPDGTPKEGDEAEQEIMRLVGLSFRDFATTVYQHQENVRAIVIQTPSERNDAIDRLLGMSDYRNVLDGIKRSKIADAQKKLTSQLEQFQTRIEDALRIRQEDVKHKKKEAVDSGLDESELNEEKLLEGAENVRKQIEEFASELGISATPVSSPSDWKDAPSFRHEAQKELDRLWSESPDLKEQSELNTRRTEADAIKTNYESQRQALSTATAKLQEFEREHGGQTQIDDEIENTQKQIDAVDDEIRQVSPKAKLVEEGIAILDAARPDESTDVCPLCGETVPNLLDHLRKEWVERIEAQVRALKARRAALAEKKAKLIDLKTQHESLTENLAKARELLAGAVQKAAEFLDRELTDQDDPAALLSIEIGKIDDRLKQIAEAIRGKREALNRISQSLNRLSLLYDVLELEDKIGRIEKIAETDEYRELENIRDRVAVLVVDVEVIDKFVRENMSKEAKTKMKAAGDAIDDYFQKIVGNPAAQKLVVEIEEDKRTGGNSYTFRDQNGEEFKPISSQGDMTGLALSMFLGLVKAYAHPIGFVLMDDPSQSLGTRQKQRLVEVLDEVCRSGRNIIVGTMDSELQEFLESSLTTAKTVYEFSEWEPESGPQVVKRV